MTLGAEFNVEGLIFRDWNTLEELSRGARLKELPICFKTCETTETPRFVPPSWKDFKNNLKHKKEELNLVELGSHFQIEQSIRDMERGSVGGTKTMPGSHVNMVGGLERVEVKEKTRLVQVDPRIPESNQVCFWSNMSCVQKSSMVQGLYPIEDGSMLKMGNVATEPIKGLGSVNLVFTSGNSLLLNNVVYVPGILTFIDDATRYCYVYLCHTKYEALDKFKIYKEEVELYHGVKIKTLRTDRGGEYYDPVYFQSTGIIHQTTAPYTPQQNGVSERKNRTLKEMVNSMLCYSGLSDGFWGEAMLTACYLLNRVPNKRNKLWFYVIEPNDYVSVHSVIDSRDADFGNEDRFTSLPKPADMTASSSNFGSRNEIDFLYQYCFNIDEDPRTYSEAMASRDAGFWKEAIQDEMDSIMQKILGNG
ncbi:zinc finger, CCHC-type containing protein [Tanacetum coccineum]|uniref:Zinc finger, CCHC-type containing protein n=1 Tax=Tanacetum coccineum TaxID=301880 RepID=A0ABQ5APK4_9ASTR